MAFTKIRSRVRNKFHSRNKLDGQLSDADETMSIMSDDSVAMTAVRSDKASRLHAVYAHQMSVEPNQSLASHVTDRQTATPCLEPVPLPRRIYQFWQRKTPWLTLQATRKLQAFATSDWLSTLPETCFARTTAVSVTRKHSSYFIAWYSPAMLQRSGAEGLI